MRWRSLALGIVLVLAGCGVTPTPTPTPSPSPSAGTASPSPTATPVAPSESASASPSTLAPDSVAKVVTTDLVMRSAPGTGPDSEIYEQQLDQPTLLFILDGPIAASGYDWYLVQPFTLSGTVFEVRPGWVAEADKTGERWVIPEAIQCAEEPDLDALIALGGVASLACYGDRPLTFPARYDGFDALIPSTVSPGWLGAFGVILRPIGCVSDCPATPSPDAPERYLFVHEPSVGAGPNSFGYPEGSALRITGRFDDPAARTCTAGPLPGATEPVPIAQTVLFCRTQFVITEATFVID